MPTAAARRWSTDTVDPAQRLDYWVGAICEGFLEMDATSGVRGTFGAELQSVPLDAVTVHQVLGSAQDVYRRPHAIARSRTDYYYLLWKAGTPCAVEQVGRDTRLRPGDLALIDSRRSYALHFPETVDVLSLQLPIGWLETWVADPTALLARRIDGQHGWGQVLGSFVRQLQPGLCAGDAAEALGLSVRTLYRGLAAARTTFADRLLHHRLAAARRMLGSRHFDALTLAEIGRRAGWPDASHFTRVCKRAWGQTPQQLRQRR
jgi:AraC-like DNA-binding protein